MSHPLRENLEIAERAGAQWIRCTKCEFQYCRGEQDWREFCRVRLLPPGSAGSLLAILESAFLMRQLYCPCCGVLLDTDFIEKRSTLRHQSP